MYVLTNMACCVKLVKQIKLLLYFLNPDLEQSRIILQNESTEAHIFKMVNSAVYLFVHLILLICSGNNIIAGITDNSSFEDLVLS